MDKHLGSPGGSKISFDTGQDLDFTQIITELSAPKLDTKLSLPALNAEELRKLAIKAQPPTLPPDWSEKHSALVAKAAHTQSQLQFFGDSITEYIDNGNLQAFERNFSALHPAAFGIAGDTTTGLLKRLNDGELGGHPSEIVILIGTNDLATAETAHEISLNIADIALTVRLHEPQAKILLMGLLPRYAPDDPLRSMEMVKLEAVNKEIAQLADGDKIRYVDIGDKFEDPNGFVRQDLLPDFLHPDRAGYELWSDAIRPLIEETQK